MLGWLVLFAGCGGSENISDHLSVFGQHLTDARSEAVRHLRAIEHASTMGSIGVLEDNHLDWMGVETHSMRVELGGMMGCSGPNEMMSSARLLSADVNDMESEGWKHRMAMATQNLDWALVEEARYQAAMADLFSRADTHRSTMMQGYGWQSCAH